MSLEIILIGLCCILFSLCLFFAWKLYKFSIIIMNIEDAIEDSLDILNQRYGKMNEILQKPVFFDSMEVRQVINDIRDCHNAILLVANKLTNNMGIKSGEVEKENS